MKKIIVISLLFVSVLLSFYSCEKTTKASFKPSVTGASGELIVLINKSLWKSSVGDSLKAVLAQFQDGLPQAEPLFDLRQLDHKDFSQMFKTHRNILDLRVKSGFSKSNITHKNDFYSRTQAFMKLEAKSKEDMIKLIMSNKNKLISYFVIAERKRKVISVSQKPVRQIFDRLLSKFNFSLSFPSGYSINKDAKDFLWVSHETPRSSQGMFIYSFDYTSEKQFSEKYLSDKRDSLLKAHVPGPLPGTYMKTEERFPMSFNHLTFMSNYCFQSRGLWKVQNDFMGGPILCYAFLDQTTNRIVCLDAYVYFPNNKKREKLRELESIIYSYKKKIIEDKK